MLLLELFQLHWVMRTNELCQRGPIRRLLAQQLIAADHRERGREVRPLLPVPAVAAVRARVPIEVLDYPFLPRGRCRFFLSERSARNNRRRTHGGCSFQDLAARQL